MMAPHCSQRKMLIDTHCHIHDPEFGFDVSTVLTDAHASGVEKMICIGTNGMDSEQAVAFAHQYDNIWATVGLHPHDAKVGEDDFEILARLASDEKVVGIGECGLDYYYDHSPKSAQKVALEYQLQLALSVGKPLSFHVRDAFDDFWSILDNFVGVRGVIHSFTASTLEVEEAMKRGLYIALNGIMTFTKEQYQRDAAKAVPLEKLMLETDAPFLTPTPLRGKMNVPANVRLVAAYLAELRGEPLDKLIEATTKNAQTLFMQLSN